MWNALFLRFPSSRRSSISRLIRLVLCCQPPGDNSSTWATVSFPADNTAEILPKEERTEQSEESQVSKLDVRGNVQAGGMEAMRASEREVKHSSYGLFAFPSLPF